MNDRVSSPMGLLVGLQIAGVLAGLLLVAFWPPANGEMLLIPVGAHSETGLAAAAITRGARLVAAGPFPGSLIVTGDRATLAPMARAGVVILAGSAAFCGARVRGTIA